MPTRKGSKLDNQQEHSDKKLKISVSTGHQGRVVNKTIEWGSLCAKMAATVKDNITLAEYNKLSIEAKHKKKNQGYFVGGQFAEGKRNIVSLKDRTVLTFDIDQCPLPLLSELIDPFDGWLAGYAYAVYSTRSHTRANPRLRVAVPLDDPIPKSAYAPLSRIVAEKLDSRMEAVDPVSFRPAQIMYWPSTCKDQEFIFYENKGHLMNAEAILTAWGDWSDYSNLPRSPRERNLREIGTSVKNPRDKHGIVGAFCRTYDIHEAISEFLAEEYTPGDTGPDGVSRYTYTKGSTTNGAIVYDDLYIYSWHGTDPCADKLVNAFDLVRLHKFGDKDKPQSLEETEGDTTKLPSYVAMAEWAGKIPVVAMELTKGLYDFDAMEADFEADDPVDPDSVEPGSIALEVTSDVEEKDTGSGTEVTSGSKADWINDLDRTETGAVKTTLHNVIMILRNDKRFKGALGYNEFFNETVLVRRIVAKQFDHDSGPIRDKENGDFISGEPGAILRAVMEAPRGEGKSGWGLRVPDRDIDAAVTVLTMGHRFHPVKRYLDAIQWDGKPRVEKMWQTYWHAERQPDNYLRETALCFMTAAIARIYEPGHKFDFVPILEGPQGSRKSSSLAALAGASRFAEFKADVTKTDKVIENLTGKWIVEIPELVQFGRTETEVLKALFSTQKDRARLAWARGPKDYHRQNVFIGTTNQRLYLKDLTGNRRYWPIALSGSTIDTVGLLRDRDQLWAEAREHYHFLRRQSPNKEVPLPLYLSAEVTSIAEVEQDLRMITSTEEIVSGDVWRWLDTPVPDYAAVVGYRGDGMDEPEDAQLVYRQEVSVYDVMTFCFSLTSEKINDPMARKIGSALSNAVGWTAIGPRRDMYGDIRKIWRRTARK